MFVHTQLRYCSRCNKLSQSYRQTKGLFELFVLFYRSIYHFSTNAVFKACNQCWYSVITKIEGKDVIKLLIVIVLIIISNLSIRVGGIHIESGCNLRGIERCSRPSCRNPTLGVYLVGILFCMVLEVECASNNLRKITKNSSNVGHTNCSERALTGF